MTLESNEKKSFLLNQLKAFCKKDVKPDLLAYEPIWALGTGIEADSENMKSSVSIINDFLEQKKSTPQFCMEEVFRLRIYTR